MQTKQIRCALCALVGLGWVLSLGSPAAALTLDDATALALNHNPELKTYAPRLQALAGARRTAALSPALALELEVENFAGSGELQGLDNAEYTLALSSALELGGKREARVRSGNARYQRVQAEREAQALALLGDVTRAFIRALTLQEKQQLAADAKALAQTTFEVVATKVERGAVPLPEKLRAQGAVTRAGLEEQRLAGELASAKLALVSHWGAEELPETLAGSLYRFTPQPAFAELYQRALQNPALLVFAQEAALAQAELELARAQATADLHWRLGVKRLQDLDETALVASLSLPLFSGSRGRGDVTAANAGRVQAQLQAQSAQLTLRTRLFDAWQTRRTQVSAVETMRRDLLPTLEQALTEARRAYERGLYNYLDWAAVQSETIASRLAMIDAASAALISQTLIEQLTAQPLNAPLATALPGQASPAPTTPTTTMPSTRSPVDAARQAPIDNQKVMP